MINDYSFLSPIESEQPYSITEINKTIANILESGNTLVWVEGEISNWRKTSTGHIYFRLKDEYSQIPSVIWRSSVSELKFEPEDGMEVLVVASVRVYQRGGYYQLDVHRMQPLGAGVQQLAFEQLKARLENEGLFDSAHKKPLPESITTVGVVTSKNGAAIQDIIKVTLSRAPQTDIVLVDVAVQGDNAPREIAKAIRLLNRYKKVDCIIVGRGGGATEDLWAFNDEMVARAVYESEIPIISAVGHEIDVTIIDFVADLRAPTPSAAAEMVVADTKENKRYFEACSQRFISLLYRYFLGINAHYNDLTYRSALLKPLRKFLAVQKTLATRQKRVLRCMEVLMKQFNGRQSFALSKLDSLSPLAVLARGYSVVTSENGTSIRNASQLKQNEMVRLIFSQGKASAKITSIDNNK